MISISSKSKKSRSSNLRSSERALKKIGADWLSYWRSELLRKRRRRKHKQVFDKTLIKTLYI